MTVTAAHLVHEGRVLAAGRRPGAGRGGLWEPPGGKVEPVEKHVGQLNAARRKWLESRRDADIW